MADREHIQAVVLREIAGYLAEEGRDRTVLEPDDGLVDSGLDSLGVAVVITRLEDALGYDPFQEYTGDAYPRTVRELVDVYAEACSDACSDVCSDPDPRAARVPGS